MTELVFSSRNGHKIREVGALLAGLPVSVRSALDCPGLPEVEETGTTFEENALLKAFAAARFAGCPALADDSGLEVEALGGRPGVLSARFAGPGADDAANNALLLQLLGPHEDEGRRARFRCVMALADSQRALALVEGVCPGRILRQPRGEKGFGYDPLFVPDGFETTFAQMTMEEKNRISHRARALALMRERLEALWPGR